MNKRVLNLKEWLLIYIIHKGSIRLAGLLMVLNKGEQRGSHWVQCTWLVECCLWYSQKKMGERIGNQGLSIVERALPLMSFGDSILFVAVQPGWVECFQVSCKQEFRTSAYKKLSPGSGGS